MSLKKLLPGICQTVIKMEEKLVKAWDGLVLIQQVQPQIKLALLGLVQLAARLIIVGWKS